MAKTYQLDTMVSPTSLLARARRAASENGATLVGDERSGRFSHELVRGEYRMAGQRVVVTITKKHRSNPSTMLREGGASGSGLLSPSCGAVRHPPTHSRAVTTSRGAE